MTDSPVNMICHALEEVEKNFQHACDILMAVEDRQEAVAHGVENIELFSRSGMMLVKHWPHGMLGKIFYISGKSYALKGIPSLNQFPYQFIV